MNINFFEMQEWEKPIITKELKGHYINFNAEPLSQENISKAEGVEILSVFIYSKIDKQILDQLPDLKMIVTRSTGFDHINIKECDKRGIMVCNVPTYGENTVAEHTFALILDLSRNVHKAYMRISQDNFSIEGLKGFDLKGKTLGVIGTGHIGSHVIKIARGFEMNVLAFDPHPNKTLAKKFAFIYTTFDKLLKESDIITIHVPFIKETHHLIDRHALSLMKPSALLINTSRGEIVDTKSLLESLKENKLAGAGLDVIEGEYLIKEEKQLLHSAAHLHAQKLREALQAYLLVHNEKVTFTPHIAFYSDEALRRILDCTLANIQSFIRKKPQCIVCMDKL